MKYFKKDFLDFFKELAANNCKDWMDENRSRYFKSVKDPFKRFVEDVINELGKIDPAIASLEAKNAIFRIHRDIRFSKDKTPYKTQVSAVVSATGKKPMSLPGVYFELGPADFRVYGGVYSLSTTELQSVRLEIADNEKKFVKLINEPKFVNFYGEVLGAKNKRIHKEFREVGERVPLMYNKSFYFFKKYPASIILKGNLMETIVEGYEAGKNLSLFLQKPLSI